jgi:hypothetical protein
LTDKYKVPATGVSRAAHLVADEELPKAFSWKEVDGQSLVTKNLNQHLPQVSARGLSVTHGVSLFVFPCVVELLNTY